MLVCILYFLNFFKKKIPFYIIYCCLIRVFVSCFLYVLGFLQKPLQFLSFKHHWNINPALFRMTIFLGVSSSSQHPWRPDDTGQAVALELWDKGGFGLFHRSSESFSRNSRSSRISGSMPCHSSKNIAICYEEKLVSKSFVSLNWFSDRWFCCRFRTLFKSFSRNSRSSRISGSVPCHSSKNLAILYEEKLVSKSFV